MPDGIFNTASTVPENLRSWVARSIDGVVASADRLATVRPAWKITVGKPGAPARAYIIRCARPSGFGLSAVYSLEREATILRSLHAQGLPVPTVVAQSLEPSALLLECMRGTSDFASLDQNADHKRRVVTTFIEVLAKVHRTPPSSFGLDHILTMPRAPQDHALLELDTWERLYRSAAKTVDPFLRLTFGWLRAHAPRSAQTVLVQGDTGPNQCLFDHQGITGVLDWELAHFGDPMEDLGWIAARSFFAQFGELPEIFQLYSRLSGIPLDLERIQFYRVMALIKCAVATGLAREGMGTGDDLASILSWDTITRLALAHSLMEVLGLPTDSGRPAPASTGKVSRHPQLYAILAETFRTAASTQTDAFEKQRLRGLADIVRLLEIDSAQVTHADSGPPSESDLHELTRHYYREEQRNMALVEQSLGRLGRIYFEPLA